MKANYISTKVIELGSCAFRQWRASHSHCHFVHGYQLKAKFWFGCTELDNKNWAVDFGGLKELKVILQNQFDHTLCVAADDPCLDLFKEMERRDACVLRIMPNGVGIERAAEYCFNTAAVWLKERYGDRCWVEQVEVFEHEDNSAVFKLTVPVEVAEIKVEAAPAAPPMPVNNSMPAQVGNAVSTGKGNWFGGTSWGN